MDHLVARRTGVTNGRKLRTDGTVVESHIRPASDNPLLADEVRVLVRTLVELTVQEPLKNFTQKAKHNVWHKPWKPFCPAPSRSQLQKRS